MPVFDATISSRLLWPLDSPWPRRRARAVISQFQRRFPDLTYEFDLDIRIANAQAVIHDDRRLVRVYGGLVRHRKLTSAGLAFVLAHETGHHVAGPPWHPVLRWLSSEERSTEWAMTEGLQLVFGKRRAAGMAARGRKNLQSIRND